MSGELKRRLKDGERWKGYNYLSMNNLNFFNLPYLQMRELWLKIAFEWFVELDNLVAGKILVFVTYRYQELLKL